MSEELYIQKVAKDIADHIKECARIDEENAKRVDEENYTPVPYPPSPQHDPLKLQKEMIQRMGRKK